MSQNPYEPPVDPTTEVKEERKPVSVTIWLLSLVNSCWVGLVLGLLLHIQDIHWVSLICCLASYLLLLGYILLPALKEQDIFSFYFFAVAICMLGTPCIVYYGFSFLDLSHDGIQLILEIIIFLMSLVSILITFIPSLLRKSYEFHHVVNESE